MTFEFAFEVRISVLRVYERSRGSVRSVFLGRVTVSWLLATMEALQQAEGSKELVKPSRVGNKVFAVSDVQTTLGATCSCEYGGGARRGLVVVREDRDGTGWLGFALELRKFLEFLQTNFVFGNKSVHVGVAFCGHSLSSMVVRAPAARGGGC
jgi:hypothetical protein